MKTRALAFALGLPLLAAAPLSAVAADPAPAKATRPALTVSTVAPQALAIPLTVNANGNIAAWQEASIGTETNGWRLVEVLVNVGDTVKRGQLLARFDDAVANAQLAQAKAAVTEAEAALAAAGADAQRARDLQTSAALSAQQITQYLTAEQTAKARLEVQRAALKVQQVMVERTKLTAPDDGVISGRTATVGAVAGAGQELFRLIRQGRLEWRAEVAAADLGNIRPGQSVQLTPVGGSPIVGKVRMIAPTVDLASRNGLVYVDLTKAAGAKAGMFARGTFDVGGRTGYTLPQSAVLLRDGFSYVFRVLPDSTVQQAKVSTGRTLGDRVEITAGLDAKGSYVLTGGGFLSDGDIVRVVAAPAAR